MLHVFEVDDAVVVIVGGVGNVGGEYSVFFHSCYSSNFISEPTA